MESFDYIVVGAGTAGCVLAARLSADQSHRVLLIEAGSATPSAPMSDPLAWPRLAGTDVDWNYVTVPQASTNREVHRFPRGKVLGGSSGINGMMHIRGDRSSYDAWQAAGAIGWDFDSLLPYFKRSEHVPGGDPAYRGTHGPMLVAPAETTAALWEACYEAAIEAGYPANDNNGASAIGTSWNDMNVANGKRQSAADAYLAPVLGRPNLQVTTDAYARRLLLEGGSCRGIEYTLGGRLCTARADREVVLTAGVIGSAQLLLLSGVGPADHLRAIGIEVVADLPGVGANLQDHPKSQVAYTTSTSVRPDGYARKPHVLLRSTPGAPPDIQVIFIEAPLHPRWKPGPENGYSVIFSLMNPASRGQVRLASADPERSPFIDPNYLGDPGDVDRMVTGLHVARQIGSAHALAKWRDEELYPGPGVQSDESLRGYLSSSVTGYFHPVGTCKIGDDPMSVVDPQLKVHGISGLRVADASVMPTIVSGNTNAAVLAIAERTAAILAGDPATAADDSWAS